VSVGGTTFDVPAATYPLPDPANAAGLFKPRYRVGTADGPRLLWCQDPRHVPVKLASISFRGGGLVQVPRGFVPPPGEVYPTLAIFDPRSPGQRNFSDLADALSSKSWSFYEHNWNGSLERYAFRGTSGETATVACFQFKRAGQKIAVQGPVCDTRVRVGQLLGFIRFRPGNTDPTIYPQLIEAAATYIDSLRSSVPPKELVHEL
jgi:hypothetical protein